MARFRVNEKADQDIDRLFEFGIDHFGLESARAYVLGLNDRFQEIAEHPRRYPTIDHIRHGFRRSVFGGHTIYFREHNGFIEIMRVLGREEPSSALDET